jgi:hypothetical protein
VISAVVVLLALRGYQPDPARPWWSLVSILGAGSIATALGLARRSQPYAYASTVLAVLAFSVFWFAPEVRPWLTPLVPQLRDVLQVWLEVSVLVTITVAGFWLSREISSQRRLAQSFDVKTLLPRVHVTAAELIVPLYVLYRFNLAFSPLGSTTVTAQVAAVVTMLALGSLLLAAFWDRRATFVLPLVYVWGGGMWCLAILFMRPWLPTEPSRLVAFMLATAAHVALSGQIWSFGANLAAVGARCGISDPVAGLARTERWLPVISMLLTTVVSIASLVAVLTFTDVSPRVALALRVAAALGPAIAAWGVLCLAQERRRDAFQLASLLLAGLSAIYLAWAQLDPQLDAIWMTRVFRLLMVLGALTCAYGLVLPRLLLTAGSWNAATRKAGHIAAVAAFAAFALTLALEVQLFTAGQQATIDGVQVAAIAVVLVGLIAGLISLAVLPGRDPLVLSEQGRQGYVYAAEVTAGLLFAHLYICRPEWFGLLRPYWPFVVMAIAFAGVGAAEFFERRRIRVLAEPLANTGAMLPLLPVIGWWVARPTVDYSLVLLIVGLLYLALSYTRKSWAAMIAATIAGNGALWALLSDTQMDFATNPQLWLIPPALSVLVAAQINRRRLSAEALAAVRYAAMLVIYVSSTSEIITDGFDAGLLPPVILLSLAVVGALAGIALQVRAFLVLGSSFTLVALIAMVRHAAHSFGHGWPWWVFIIAMGVSILVLFGIFEKKRQEVTLLIARLRQWEQ